MRHALAGALLVLLALVGSARVLGVSSLGRLFAHLQTVGLLFPFVGLLLGPLGLGLLDATLIEALRPAQVLGLGWIGFLVGMQFDRRLLARFPAALYAMAFVESGIAFALVAVPFWAIFTLWGEGAPGSIGWWSPAAAAALVAAACAAVSSPLAALLARRSGRGDRDVARVLAFLAGLDDLLSLCVVALVFALFQATPDAPLRFHAGWIGVTLALGAAVGLLAWVLIRPRAARHEHAALVLGLVALAGGAAAFLRLSPLFVGFVAGMAFANAPGAQSGVVYRVLVRAERPIYLVFLLIAGASWNVGSWRSLAALPAWLALRFLGKYAGGRLAARLGRGVLPLPPALGLGLMAQGGMAIAIALGFQRVFPGPLPQVVLDLAIFGAIANEFLALALTGRALDRRATPERSARAAPATEAAT